MSTKEMLDKAAVRQEAILAQLDQIMREQENQRTMINQIKSEMSANYVAYEAWAREVYTSSKEQAAWHHIS